MTKDTKYCFICFLWACLWMLAACHDEQEPTAPSGERVITFQLEIVNGTGNTRANEGTLINSVYVLAFNAGDDKFLFGATADKDAGDPTKYNVALDANISTGTSLYFALLVNYNPSATLVASFADLEFADVTDLLLLTENDLPTGYIPMFGITTAQSMVSGANFSGVKLVRMQAKIEVENENGGVAANTQYRNNFVLKEVHLVTPPLKGYLAYANTPTPGTSLKQITSTSPNEKYYYTEPYAWPSPVELNSTVLERKGTDIEIDATDPHLGKMKEPIYTFERPLPATGEEETYLLIIGTYKGEYGTASEEVEHTYKVSIPELDYAAAAIPVPAVNPFTKGPIVRNHHYVLKIREAHPLTLNFLLTVVPWTDVPMVDDILDKTYTMTVDPLETILIPDYKGTTAEEKFKFSCDYMWDYEIFANKECTDSIKKDDAWFNISVLPNKDVWVKGKNYYPPTDGIEFTATANHNYGALRTCYIKFTGYGTDVVRDSIVYESVSLLETITQRAYMEEESNCYVIDNNTPQTVFNIPISRIQTAITDGIITDDLDTWIPVADRDKLRAQVFWTDRQQPDNIEEGLFGTPGSVVESVEYIKDATDFINGYIRVIPGEGVGNAGVILFLDREGNDNKYTPGTADKICWSWHIWNTYNFPKVASGEYMDRNLGAHRSKPGDLSSVGFFYQWGRKDPLPGLSAWEISENTKTDYASYQKVKMFFDLDAHLNPSPEDNNAGDLKTMFEPQAGPSDIQETVENPLSLYKDWASKTASDFWSSGKPSTNPCPVGYKVVEEWPQSSWAGKVGDIYAVGDYSTGYIYGQRHTSMNGNYEMIALYYPAAGYGFEQNGGTAMNNYIVVETSKVGYYWSANYSGGVLYFEGTTVNPSETLTHEKGTPIRCQKE